MVPAAAGVSPAGVSNRRRDQSGAPRAESLARRLRGNRGGQGPGDGPAGNRRHPSLSDTRRGFVAAFPAIRPPNVTNHGYTGYPVVTTQKFWEGLPPDIRPELDGAIDEATKFANDVARQDNEAALGRTARGRSSGSRRERFPDTARDRHGRPPVTRRRLPRPRVSVPGVSELAARGVFPAPAHWHRASGRDGRQGVRVQLSGMSSGKSCEIPWWHSMQVCFSFAAAWCCLRARGFCGSRSIASSE